MQVGYARVSTHDQTLDLQLDALKKEECGRVSTDQLSGAKTERPGLTEAMSHLRSGHVLVVWRLDRLGRCRPPRKRQPLCLYPLDPNGTQSCA